MENGRQVGLIANCVFCDSYFMQIITRVVLQNYKGSSGKEILNDVYKKIQNKYSDHRIHFLHCPTCTELCYGIKFQEIFLKEHPESTLSLAHFIRFENDVPDDDELKGVPVYINTSDNSMKPKWALAFGIGPQKIELDTSKSGRIYKPSLKQYGLDSKMYIGDRKPNEYTYISNTLIDAIRGCSKDELDTLVQRLFSLKPVFKNWDKIQGEIEALALSKQFEEQEFE